MSMTQPSPFPDLIPDYVDDDVSCWNAPFRWYWCQDRGQFEPYNNTINRILERSYEQWKLHGGPSAIFVPLDVTSQIYQIDYKNNRQINRNTSYQRAIDRRLLDKSPGNKKWFYRDKHGNWIWYESLVENLIEQGYQLYRSGQGSSSIDIQFPERPETYQINFLLGQQINKTTSAIKSIKYEQGCPEPVKIAAGLKLFRRFINNVSKLV